MLLAGSILLLLSPGGVPVRTADLAVTPVTCVGGQLAIDVGIAKEECACIFASVRGAGGVRQLPRVAGTFRLEDPLVYLGIVVGPGLD